mmetsp:Transcript_22667/g.69235  ORF Transcript_22667/g.69235 Transcript_22667/m.69235 type:complete len:381 (+) Transcript_22667:132-1274(+)
MGCAASTRATPAGELQFKRAILNTPLLEHVQPEPQSCSEPHTSAIHALHSKFDIDGTGVLALDLLSSVKIKFGPHHASLLGQLVHMDYDADGMITKEEWERYFEATAASLTPDEFRTVISDFSEAADHFISIVQCTRLAEAAAQDAPIVDDSDTELSPLTADRFELVENMFKVWDFGEAGVVELSKLRGQKIDIGPHNVDLLSGIAACDLDGDGSVTKEDLMMYFSAASPNLTDSEFSEIVADLQQRGETARTIFLSATTFEEEACDPTSIRDEGNAAPLPLSQSRLELASSLYMVFSPDLDQPVRLDELAKLRLRNGPTEVSVFNHLQAMDANGDNMVTWEEMQAYLGIVGGQLNDDDFESIIVELISAARVNELVRAP